MLLEVLHHMPLAQEMSRSLTTCPLTSSEHLLDSIAHTGIKISEKTLWQLSTVHFLQLVEHPLVSFSCLPFEKSKSQNDVLVVA